MADVSEYDDGDIVLVSLDPLLYGRVIKTVSSVRVEVDPSLSLPSDTPEP